jgi:hypothetical protein
LCYTLCTVSAAVTNALLDSTEHSGSEYSFVKNPAAKFFTQPKNLCYYAGLILLHKFFLLWGSRDRKIGRIPQ